MQPGASHYMQPAAHWFRLFSPSQLVSQAQIVAWGQSLPSYWSSLFIANYFLPRGFAFMCPWWICGTEGGSRVQPTTWGPCDMESCATWHMPSYQLNRALVLHYHHQLQEVTRHALVKHRTLFTFQVLTVLNTSQIITQRLLLNSSAI